MFNYQVQKAGIEAAKKAFDEASAAGIYGDAAYALATEAQCAARAEEYAKITNK